MSKELPHADCACCCSDVQNGLSATSLGGTAVCLESHTMQTVGTAAWSTHHEVSGRLGVCCVGVRPRHLEQQGLDGSFIDAHIFQSPTYHCMVACACLARQSCHPPSHACLLSDVPIRCKLQLPRSSQAETNTSFIFKSRPL